MLWTMKGLKFLKVLKNFLFEKKNTNISFLNSTFVSNIIKKNVTQNVSNSNSVLSSYISDLFLQEKADVQISEKETYLNPYIILQSNWHEKFKIGYWKFKNFTTDFSF